MKHFDVVVLGAGSVGLPLAWRLAERGFSVALVDEEASWGRGQNRAAIGGVRATHSDPAKIRVCLESISIFSTMRENYGLDVEWRSGGYLYVAYDDQTEAQFRSLLAAQQAVGLDIAWVEPDFIQRLAPGISTQNLRGGTFSPRDGYASPLMAASAFHELARRAGVSFFFNSRVEAFRKVGDAIQSIRAGGEDFSAPLFVNAAGAKAADLAKLAGFELPVFPDCHEAGVTEPVERFMEPMIVDVRSDAESGNYYFYQAGTGQVVFCVTPRPQVWGRDKDSTSGFLPLVVRRMLELYPRLRNLRVRRTWRGMYPMTPDGLPIVGYPESAKNFLQLVGMCGQGFMLGPGLGSIVASALSSGSSYATPFGGTEYGPVFDELSIKRDFDRMELLK